MSKQAVTIRDIARSTGLSIATVSMVLNKAGRRIPATTQRLVLETAKSLGYYPNLQARSLRSRRTNSIGVLVFDITDSYCTLIVRGIENSLTSFGYIPVIADLQNTPARLGRCARMLVERRVEGLIAIGNPVHLGADLPAVLERFDVPSVVIGSDPSDSKYASVVVDNVAGGRAAYEHLYSLGHRQIAVIKGPRSMGDTRPRWMGIQEAARARNSAVVATAQITGLNSSYEEGYEATKELLNSKKKFTGLITFDDLTAFASIGALTSAGFSVPRDCSVIGFDDIPGAAYYNPPLTTICQHLEEQGSIAAEILRAVLTEPKPNPLSRFHRMVQPHLAVRKSTAAPSTSSQNAKRRRQT